MGKMAKMPRTSTARTARRKRRSSKSDGTRNRRSAGPNGAKTGGMNRMRNDHEQRIDDLETLLLALEMHPMFMRQP